jgi:hypothetical protein
MRTTALHRRRNQRSQRARASGDARRAAALLLAASAITTTGAQRAFAEEIPEHFTAVRPIGMGDAFTAVANDESSVWTNPAGIARSRKARSRGVFNVTKFPNVIAGANAEGRAFYQGYKGTQDKSIEGILAETEDLGDKPFWARASVFPVALFDFGRDTPMAFGIYSNTTAKAVIPTDTPEVARVETVADLGGVLTFGVTDNENRLNAGISVRPVARYAYEDRIPSEDLLNKDTMKTRLADDSNKSQALGVDLGLLYTVADFWYPTIGLAVLNLPTGCRDGYLNPFTEKPENVCGTVYKGDFANEDALSTVDPTDVRAGLAITPRLGRKLALRFAVDVHHLPVGSTEQSYGLTGIEASKLVHAGVELFVGNPLQVSPFSLRAGYSQGFATAGATVDLGFLEVEFATYGRDVSSTATPIEDRRYLGSVSFDF